MIANDEIEKLEKNARDKSQKHFQQGKGKGYLPNTKNQRHLILRMNDLKQKGKSTVRN